MGDLLGYSWYQNEIIDLTVGDLLLLLVILFVTRLVLQGYQVFVHKKIRALDIFDKEREQIFVKIGRVTIIFIAIVTAVLSLGLAELIEYIFNYHLFKIDKVSITPGKIIILILIIGLTRFLLRFVRILLKKNFSKKSWIDEGKEYTIYKLTKYSLYIFAILIGITSIGLDIKIILGGAAALLVGIGLGLQHLFMDLTSGLIILFEGPVKVGDVIEVNGLVAKVQQIDIRTSKVVTRDGKYIIIPNAKLTSEHVVNWSHGSTLTRFKIRVRVAFGSNTQKVKDILYTSVLRHPDVSKNREIIVRFEEFGEYCLIFEVYFWAKKTWVVETLQSEIRFDIDNRFREENIHIPYPSHQLYTQLPGQP